DDGHVFAERGALVDEAREALGASDVQVNAAIDRLALQEQVVIEQDAVYLTPFHVAEKNTAKRLLELKNNRISRLSDFQKVSWEKAFNYLITQSPNHLTPKQRDAVRIALTEKVSILTGGPGTGKTTTVRAIIQLLKAKHKTFKLAAPTGRAAKRLSEATGEPAQTLHRLLEFKPFEHKKFLRDRDNPLDADLIIVDETSMIDLLLMNALLKAIDLTSHVLFVGDPDQLPSVGAGNVLKDMLASNVLPTVALDVIFRQDETSLIVSNAHRINKGEMPLFRNDARDFFLFQADDAEKAAARVVELVTTRIPQRFRMNGVSDVQVLSPMHRGQAGVGELNAQLQTALNPPTQGKRETRHGARVFRVGDKVLQTRNNYDKQIFNGDLGRIVEIDFEEQTVDIDFDGARVVYEFSELDELVHAFAMSVHKSQGSEYRAVVLPILTQHYMLLQRNLLYTAVTRAKQLVVIVGNKKAIGMAVRNNKIAQRNTRLAERLRTNDERGTTETPPKRRAEYRIE
ncbi:AAA family ATPase, partial [Anaerolineae bacterium CFX7]|nr:AAA family ATPase [Anaerolineae bacterium CFX7]